MGIYIPPPERALIVWEASATPPAGYIKANGALVSRTAYAWLFARIGTTFGAGDGSTTFALPDLRGEFLRGLDDGRGVDASRTLGSAQADALKAHNHLGPVFGSEYAAYLFTSGGVSVGVSNYTASTGGAETRPRNVAGLYCIAYMP